MATLSANRARPRRPGFGCDQASARCDPDHGAGGVEDFDQHKDDDDMEETLAKLPHDVKLEEAGLDAWRHGHYTGTLYLPGNDGQHRAGENPDQDVAAHAPGT